MKFKPIINTFVIICGTKASPAKGEVRACKHDQINLLDWQDDWYVEPYKWVVSCLLPDKKCLFGKLEMFLSMSTDASVEADLCTHCL